MSQPSGVVVLRPDESYCGLVTRLVRLGDVRRLWLMLLGLGLLARALVPAGWMPVADLHGIRLILCYGWQEAAPASSHEGGHHGAGVHHQMAASPGSAHEEGGQGQKTDHSAPCTFATSALNVPLPPEPMALLPMPTVTIVASAFSLARVGQGLAAPPPPSTGPPSIS